MLKNKPEEYAEINRKRWEKVKKTNLEKYGVDNVMKTEEGKERFKKSFFDKYGTDNPMKVPEFREKLMQTLGSSNEIEEFESKNGKKYYKYKGYPISQGQYKFYEVLGGELNYLIDNMYCVDILFDNKIYFEYNGTGHELDVKMGKMTEEEFQAKEAKRYYTLKGKGYKQFIYKSLKSEYNISEEKIFQIKDIAFNYLQQEGCNWIEFDYDNELIRTKDWSKFFKYKD